MLKSPYTAQRVSNSKERIGSQILDLTKLSIETKEWTNASYQSLTSSTACPSTTTYGAWIRIPVETTLTLVGETEIRRTWCLDAVVAVWCQLDQPCKSQTHVSMTTYNTDCSGNTLYDEFW